jgi:hypothetical protein
VIARAPHLFTLIQSYWARQSLPREFASRANSRGTLPHA